VNGYDVRRQLNGKDVGREVDTLTQEGCEKKKEIEAIKANLFTSIF